MTAHKRYTNSQKTKYTWCFVVDIPSGEYDSLGREKRKQKTKSGFATKKEALEAEKKFLDSLKDGNIELNNHSLFSEIVLYFLEDAKLHSYSKSTLDNYFGFYKNHLEYFHNIRIDKINEAVIRSWYVEAIKNNKSPHIINGCIKLLKASFNYAKKKKKITSNPFLELENISIPRKHRKRFTIIKLKEMFEVCKKEFPSFYCIFILACLTGMRLGEYTALTPQDLDFDNDCIYIDKQYTKYEIKNRNKTLNSTRIANMSLPVKLALKWHINTYGIIAGFLFKGKGNNPISPTWVRKQFRKLLIKCGYSEDFCRVHDLRGQYVDIMKAVGTPTSQIAKEVGHTRTSTTDDIYTEILAEVPKESIRKINAIFS